MIIHDFEHIKQIMTNVQCQIQIIQNKKIVNFFNRIKFSKIQIKLL